MPAPDPRKIAAPLLRWFDEAARELPWRGTRDPYRIWVSEIMLQQTQVETVRRYYDRFLEKFPDVWRLAEANQEDVLAAWSGLGFYRRARNLHKAAGVVASEHDGVFPRDPKALGKLPGLGRYTVGAVLSIAHDDRLPILDGNVTRVLARLFRVPGSPKATPVKKRLWQLAEDVLPEERCGDFNQSLMELGALVCRPKSPDCEACPLQALCAARAAGDPESFPETVPAAEVPRVERVSLYLTRPDGSFRIEQRPLEGLLAGLWELPSAELDGDSTTAVAKRIARRCGASGTPRSCGQAEHRFSHRHWTIHVFTATTRAKAALAKSPWVTPTDLADYGVPTVTRKALRVAQRAERG